ncbi:MAG TPA: amidohydrolase, partial [Acidimicrobiia bacterium]|nr:amidohydrolase [Acidimicrobiia bacterium]
GRRYGDGDITFSTDMGNVSLAMPSIHPCIGIETAGAVNHQPEFAAACINASADRAVVEGALALALTAIRAAAPGALRDRLLTA